MMKQYVAEILVGFKLHSYRLKKMEFWNFNNIIRFAIKNEYVYNLKNVPESQNILSKRLIDII